MRQLIDKQEKPDIFLKTDSTDVGVDEKSEKTGSNSMYSCKIAKH
jgi:hypothetical protein